MSQEAIKIALRVYDHHEILPQKGSTYLLDSAFQDFEGRHGFKAEGAIDHNEHWWMFWGKDEAKYQAEKTAWYSARSSEVDDIVGVG